MILIGDGSSHYCIIFAPQCMGSNNYWKKVDSHQNGCEIWSRPYQAWKYSIFRRILFLVGFAVYSFSNFLALLSGNAHNAYWTMLTSFTVTEITRAVEALIQNPIIRNVNFKVPARVSIIIFLQSMLFFSSASQNCYLNLLVSPLVQ